MPPKVKRVNSVPLLCSLCPNHPNFSDVSHLLTHISSKGHLHNRFKLQVRSQTEFEAKEQLDDFDFWYRSYNLDTLLSERLAAKDQKQAAKDKKRRALNGVLPVKKEEDRENENTLNTTPVYRAPIPRMHLWPTTGSRTYSTPTTDDWAANTIYDTPSAMRRLPHFSQETPVKNTFGPNLRTPLRSQNQARGRHEEHLVDSATKLKGILWPGMNLFDSATPEMKRMRNQRKDNTVLEHMMAASADIEPAEVSYFADGQFRASRDIFGPPSCESSPTVEKVPSPKKRKSRKPTFSNVSVNAPRSRASRTKPTVAKVDGKRSTSAMERDQAVHETPVLKSAPKINPLSTRTFGRTFAPTFEEEEDFKLTIGSTKKKRSFGIFQEATEESPESLFGEHRFDFPNHGLSTYSINPAPSRHLTPTPASKSSMCIYGKENSKPEFHPGLRSQVPPSSTSSASLVFPSQVLHDATFNPLYNEAFSRSFGYGDHYSGFNKNMNPSRYASNFNGDFRPLPVTAQTDQPQDHAVGLKNGSVSRKGMRYGM